MLILAVVLGIMPDIGRLFQKDRNDWTKFYKWAHTTSYCFYIPFWNLHIYLDKFVHKPNGGWTDNAIWYELIGWVIFIFLFIIKIKAEYI